MDKSRLTQLGRALKQLGIEHIPAYSPEARGRSERMFATLQNRLVKELAFHGITEVAAANRFIAEVYLPDHNARFSCRPELEESAFVPLASPGQLTDILCARHERIVERDNTVRYQGLWLQLPQSPLRPHYVKAKVQVHEYPDATLAIFHGPRKIASYDPAGNLVTPEELKNAA